MSRPTTPLASKTSPLSSAPPAPQTTPFRSTTAPVKKHHHHHSHHHISHRHHHHRDKSVLQSAILPASASLFSPLTKATSRNEGAPDISSLIKEEREARARKEAKEKGGDGEKEDPAKVDKETIKRAWDLVQQRRAARKRGEEALTTSLQSLSALSTSTTRRLDYTYYSLLSHISALQSTLSSLSSLSSTTSTLLSSFISQSSSLTQDLRAQISAHANNTKIQASRLKALEERMNEGKKRVEGLGARMEKVRTKVREQETKEGQWSERVRKRVRVCWGVLAVGLILVIVGVVVRHWPKVEKGLEAVDMVGNGALGVDEITGWWVGNSSGLGKTMKVGAKEDGKVEEGKSEERVLRMLDEL